ncbi:hypothetical protein [Shewanella gelidii]|uniref:DUF4131 domain-containing protein n=1 Tax=Shewanella gelidii TaxID=1642821 RepID=A0A917JRE4_9GAMM|nr:hypothetical protein [Shewanella gelidii]MCL1098466.1 hypothetical protein [Shewanella gelidii]GGI82568.1 hypothetical protein GCM10009332_19710 [Shewanella gelidii]
MVFYTVFELIPYTFIDYALMPILLMYLFLVLLGIIFKKKLVGMAKKVRESFLFSYTLVGMAVLFLVLECSYYSDHHELLADYKNGRFQVIEGRVTDFQTDTHKESFFVAGAFFEYEQFLIAPFFHTVSAEGGPIKEGLKVRLSHVEGKIVKLEIAQ